MKTSQHKLALDLDGVIADWAAGAEKIIGYRIDDASQHYPDEDWQKLHTHGRLFQDLPKMKQADEMVELARKFRDDLGYELVFLTAIPHNNDMPYAFWDKMLWAQKYYPDIPVHFGPYSVDKQVHCNYGDILVDDRHDNCKQWEAAGGTAVQVPYDQYSTALNKLDTILERKLALQRLARMGVNNADLDLLS